MAAECLYFFRQGFTNVTVFCLSDHPEHRTPALKKQVIERNLPPSITENENSTPKYLDIFSVSLKDGGLNLNDPGHPDVDFENSEWISETLETHDMKEATHENKNSANKEVAARASEK